MRWVATVPRQPVDQQGAPTSDTPCCSPWREPGAQHRGQYLPKPMAGGPDFFQRINKSVGISRRSRYTHEGFFQKDQQANLDIHCSFGTKYHAEEAPRASVSADLPGCRSLRPGILAEHCSEVGRHGPPPVRRPVGSPHLETPMLLTVARTWTTAME